MVGTVREIALICVELPAGALSDRFDRRLTMIACDTVRAALLAVLGILVAVHLASWPVPALRRQAQLVTARRGQLRQL